MGRASNALHLQHQLQDQTYYIQASAFDKKRYQFLCYGFEIDQVTQPSYLTIWSLRRQLRKHQLVASGMSTAPRKCQIQYLESLDIYLLLLLTPVESKTLFPLHTGVVYLLDPVTLQSILHWECPNLIALEFNPLRNLLLLCNLVKESSVVLELASISKTGQQIQLHSLSRSVLHQKEEPVVEAPSPKPLSRNSRGISIDLPSLAAIPEPKQSEHTPIATASCELSQLFLSPFSGRVVGLLADRETLIEWDLSTPSIPTQLYRSSLASCPFPPIVVCSFLLISMRSVQQEQVLCVHENGLISSCNLESGEFHQLVLESKPFTRVLPAPHPNAFYGITKAGIVSCFQVASEGQCVCLGTYDCFHLESIQPQLHQDFLRHQLKPFKTQLAMTTPELMPFAFDSGQYHQNLLFVSFHQTIFVFQIRAQMYHQLSTPSDIQAIHATPSATHVFILGSDHVVYRSLVSAQSFCAVPVTKEKVMQVEVDNTTNQLLVILRSKVRVYDAPVYDHYLEFTDPGLQEALTKVLLVGPALLASDRIGKLYQWMLAKKSQSKAMRQWRAHDDEITNLLAVPSALDLVDEKRFVSIDSHGLMKLWVLAFGWHEKCHVEKFVVPAELHCLVSCSFLWHFHDFVYYANGFDDGKISCGHFNAQEQKYQVQAQHAHRVSMISQWKTHLVSTSYDTKVVLWNLHPTKDAEELLAPLRSFEFGHRILLAIHPKASDFIFCLRDNNLRMLCSFDLHQRRLRDIAPVQADPSPTSVPAAPTSTPTPSASEQPEKASVDVSIPSTPVACVIKTSLPALEPHATSEEDTREVDPQNPSRIQSQVLEVIAKYLHVDPQKLVDEHGMPSKSRFCTVGDFRRLYRLWQPKDKLPRKFISEYIREQKLQLQTKVSIQQTMQTLVLFQQLNQSSSSPNIPSAPSRTKAPRILKRVLYNSVGEKRVEEITLGSPSRKRQAKSRRKASIYYALTKPPTWASKVTFSSSIPPIALQNYWKPGVCWCPNRRIVLLKVAAGDKGRRVRCKSCQKYKLVIPSAVEKTSTFPSDSLVLVIHEIYCHLFAEWQEKQCLYENTATLLCRWVWKVFTLRYGHGNASEHRILVFLHSLTLYRDHLLIAMFRQMLQLHHIDKQEADTNELEPTTSIAFQFYLQSYFWFYERHLLFQAPTSSNQTHRFHHVGFDRVQQCCQEVLVYPLITPHVVQRLIQHFKKHCQQQQSLDLEVLFVLKWIVLEWQKAQANAIIAYHELFPADTALMEHLHLLLDGFILQDRHREGCIERQAFQSLLRSYYDVLWSSSHISLVHQQHIIQKLIRRYADADFDGQIGYLDMWCLLYVVGMKIHRLLPFEQVHEYATTYHLEIPANIQTFVVEYLQTITFPDSYKPPETFKPDEKAAARDGMLDLNKTIVSTSTANDIHHAIISDDLQFGSLKVQKPVLLSTSAFKKPPTASSAASRRRRIAQLHSELRPVTHEAKTRHQKKLPALLRQQSLPLLPSSGSGRSHSSATSRDRRHFEASSRRANNEFTNVYYRFPGVEAHAEKRQSIVSPAAAPSPTTPPRLLSVKLNFQEQHTAKASEDSPELAPFSAPATHESSPALLQLFAQSETASAFDEVSETHVEEAEVEATKEDFKADLIQHPEPLEEETLQQQAHEHSEQLEGEKDVPQDEIKALEILVPDDEAPAMDATGASNESSITATPTLYLPQVLDTAEEDQISIPTFTPVVSTPTSALETPLSIPPSSPDEVLSTHEDEDQEMDFPAVSVSPPKELNEMHKEADEDTPECPSPIQQDEMPLNTTSRCSSPQQEGKLNEADADLEASEEENDLIDKQDESIEPAADTSNTPTPSTSSSEEERECSDSKAPVAELPPPLVQRASRNRMRFSVPVCIRAVEFVRLTRASRPWIKDDHSDEEDNPESNMHQFDDEVLKETLRTTESLAVNLQFPQRQSWHDYFHACDEQMKAVINPLTVDEETPIPGPESPKKGSQVTVTTIMAASKFKNKMHSLKLNRKLREETAATLQVGVRELHFGDNVTIHQEFQPNESAYFFFQSSDAKAILTISVHLKSGDAELYVSNAAKHPCSTDHIWRSSKSSAVTRSRVVIYPSHPAAKVGVYYISVVSTKPATKFDLSIMSSGSSIETSRRMENVDQLITKFHQFNAPSTSSSSIPCTPIDESDEDEEAEDVQEEDLVEVVSDEEEPTELPPFSPGSAALLHEQDEEDNLSFQKLIESISDSVFTSMKTPKETKSGELPTLETAPEDEWREEELPALNLGKLRPIQQVKKNKVRKKATIRPIAYSLG